MSSYLNRREAIAAMVMQVFIVKHKGLPPTPNQAAPSALEHADALPELLGTQRKNSKPSSNPLRINGDLVKL